MIGATVSVAYRSHNDRDSTTDVEAETSSIARSTLANVIYNPASFEKFANSKVSSNVSSAPVTQKTKKLDPLSGTSRAIIKQCFKETTPFFLPVGHPTVAFNEEQMSNILRVIADESARASFEMLSSVVQRASQLKLSSPHDQIGVGGT